MNDGRWPRRALISLCVAIALFVLPNLLTLIGAPVELVSALSSLSLVALLIALILLAVAAYQRVRWSVGLATIALAAEIGAALLLLVREPQPAYLHPEWDWYWPVVNTLYFGGMLVCLVLDLLQSGKRDSNPRPQPWQGCALPTELFPRAVQFTP